MEGGNRGQVAWHRGNVTPSKPPPLNTPIMLIMCFGTWLVFVFAFLGVVASSTSSPRVCLFVCLSCLFAFVPNYLSLLVRCSYATCYLNAYCFFLLFSCWFLVLVGAYQEFWLSRFPALLCLLWDIVGFRIPKVSFKVRSLINIYNKIDCICLFPRNFIKNILETHFFFKC